MLKKIKDEFLCIIAQETKFDEKDFKYLSDIF